MIDPNYFDPDPDCPPPGHVYGVTIDDPCERAEAVRFAQKVLRLREQDLFVVPGHYAWEYRNRSTFMGLGELKRTGWTVYHRQGARRFDGTVRQGKEPRRLASV